MGWQTPAEVEAWAEAEEAPLHAEIAEIDAEVAALVARKRALHVEIDMIEAWSTQWRRRLRSPDAGPDQVLSLAGGLDDVEVVRLRAVAARHERR